MVLSMGLNGCVLNLHIYQNQDSDSFSYLLLFLYRADFLFGIDHIAHFWETRLAQEAAGQLWAARVPRLRERWASSTVWQLYNDAEIVPLPGPNCIRADLKMDFENHSNRSLLLESFQNEKGGNNETSAIWPPYSMRYTVCSLNTLTSTKSLSPVVLTNPRLMGKDNIALSSLRGNKTCCCMEQGSLGRGRDWSEEVRVKPE